MTTNGCVFCGGKVAGVYYGHNTGRPFRVCAPRLTSLRKYGLFRTSGDTAPKTPFPTPERAEP